MRAGVDWLMTQPHEGRTLTEHEVELVKIYGVCWCGSPRASSSRLLDDGTTYGTTYIDFICAWNGHEQ